MNQVQDYGYTRHRGVEGRDEITASTLFYNLWMDQILESRKKVDEFIGIASHELKTHHQHKPNTRFDETGNMQL